MNRPAQGGSIHLYGVPKGIRTPVAAVKGQCPRPLDDGDLELFPLVLGGARRDRTADLLHAMQALSQLSYSPGRRGLYVASRGLSRDPVCPNSFRLIN